MDDSSHAQRMDLFADDFYVRPYAMAAQARALGGPVRAVRPDGVPVWVICRHQDAKTAFRDPRLRKDYQQLIELMRRKQQNSRVGEIPAILADHVAMADPPDHTRLRALLAVPLAPRRLEALRPRIESMATQLLDAALSADEPVDMLSRFAVPLPAMVICELLGIPDQDRPDLQDWSRAMMDARQEISGPGTQQLLAYLAQLIDIKRACPGDDLVSVLLHATGPEGQMTDRQLHATALFLWVAGHETSANLIANSLRLLLESPQIADELRQAPHRIPAAVEEVLRIDSPAMMTGARFTSEPIQIGGTTIPAGEIVMIWLGAANHDNEAYPHAESADIGRFAASTDSVPRSGPASHLSFGHGIHYCLGAPLARTQAAVAIRQWLDRFPGARLALPSSSLSYRQSPLVRGLTELPVLLR